MKKLKFFTRQSNCSLSQILARALPNHSKSQVLSLLESGQVFLSGKKKNRDQKSVEAGAFLEVHCGAGQVFEPFYKELELVFEGDDFSIICKPRYWPSHQVEKGSFDPRVFVGKFLKKPLEEVLPVHRLDLGVGGLWLIAHSKQAAARLGAYFEKGEVKKTYEAEVITAFMDQGNIEFELDGKKSRTDFELTERRGFISHLKVFPKTGRTHQIRRHLHLCNMPIIGDFLYGGIMQENGLRLYSTGLRIEKEKINVSIPFPDDLKTSAKDFEFLKDLRAIPHFKKPGINSYSKIKILTTVESAIKKRIKLLKNLRRTNCFRLIHGEADALPGIQVDLVGSFLRIELRCSSLNHHLKFIHQFLMRKFRELAYNIKGTVLALNDPKLKDSGLNRLSWYEQRGNLKQRHLDNGYYYEIKENYLSYKAFLKVSSPLAYGLYPDQRQNRVQLKKLSKKNGRVLNLFCHTGAFTISALKNGASEVYNVDLSKNYLQVLDENIKLNALDPKKSKNYKQDAFYFFRKLSTNVSFDTIIIDPPTVARVGKSMWQLKRDLPLLFALCLKSLNKAGIVLLCRNDLGDLKSLEKMAFLEAKKAGRKIIQKTSAGPSEDFPVEKNQPEKASFKGIILKII